ncbi:Pre protein translocase subunit Sec66-domain-containing protein [Usnea florida]
MVDLIGLAIPFAYIGILVGSLATFSSLYRKRKAAKSTSLEPWFGPHVQRNIYLSLLHLEPQPGQEKATPIPDSILKAALLQRAVEDIRRILTIRGAKQPLSQLLQRGSVGDDLWQRFLRAEKEMEAELRDVVEEANALATNWGQSIFQSANEMVNNAAIRERVAELQAKGKADREWWDKERESISTKFLQELDEGAPQKTANPASTGAGTSDEDAVMVEAGGPAAGGSTAGSKGGTVKKRKGKK